jgi:hypothetical protein
MSCSWAEGSKFNVRGSKLMRLESFGHRVTHTTLRRSGPDWAHLNRQLDTARPNLMGLGIWDMDDDKAGQ